VTQGWNRAGLIKKPAKDLARENPIDLIKKPAKDLARENPIDQGKPR
jgi:hypothetical protein